MGKLYVVIGRCQPMHIGHGAMFIETLEATDEGDKMLILLGSSNKTRSLDNPFLYEERKQIVEMFLAHEDLDWDVLPLKDFDYDDEAWIDNLHRIIDTESDGRTPVLVCSTKNNEHLDRKEWSRGYDVFTVEPLESSLAQEKALSATQIREIMCREGFTKEVSANLVMGRHPAYFKGVEFLKSEFKVVRDYKESWSQSPFPPLFTATDAVVRDSEGKFLFIERGGEMGTGDIALAGGFLEEKLTYEQNMKKELLEEANLDLDTVNHTIVTSWMCDSVNRAHRGRMTTVAFLVQLPSPFKEYCIEAGDDAAEVRFKTLEEIDEMSLFNDHYGLIRKLLKLESMGVPYIKNH